MFVNQSVASAILVRRPAQPRHRRPSGSSTRWSAAAVALVIGVGLFPAGPARVIRATPSARCCARSPGALAHVAALLAERHAAEPGWTLAAAQDIHRQLAALAQARMTARANRAGRAAALAPARRGRGRGCAHQPASTCSRTRRSACSAPPPTRSTVPPSAPRPRSATAASAHGDARARRAPSSAAERACRGARALAASPRPWPDQTLRAVDAADRRDRRRAAGRPARPARADRSVATSCWSCPQARRSWRARRRSSSTSSHVGVNGSATTRPSESDSAATGRAIIDPIRTGAAGASSAPSSAASRSRARPVGARREAHRQARPARGGPAGRS